MSVSHELDKPCFTTMAEPNTSRGVGDTYHGDNAAKDVKKWLTENNRNLPPHVSYLALGVGQAYPEEAFARHLGIPADRVTMVDRCIAGYTRVRLAEKLP